jgi:hypothetical protein
MVACDAAGQPVRVKVCFEDNEGWVTINGDLDLRGASQARALALALSIAADQVEAHAC